LHANETVGSDELVDALWPDQPADAGRKALRVAVSRLRGSLDGEATLATRSTGYELVVPDGRLDLDRFRALTAEGDRAFDAGDSELAAERYAAALALWRGPALVDVAAEGLTAESDRLEEMRLHAVERRIDADLACGRHAELIGELDGLVRRYPFREALRRQQMLALYRAERQAEALDAYRSARRQLVDELGIEPSLELQETERAILRHDPALAAPRAPTAARDVERPSRRSLMFAGVAIAAILVVAAVVGGTLGLAGGGSSHSAVEALSVKSNSLAILDEKSGRLKGDVELGGVPTDVAVGAGAVWVLLSRAGVVVQVDPHSGKQTAIGVPPDSIGIAVGAGGVWVTDERKTLTRIDPSTGSADVPVGIAPSEVFPNAIADITATKRAVWLASRDTPFAARYLPDRGKLEVDLGGPEGDAGFFYGQGTSVIAQGFGEVWRTNRVDLGDTSSGEHAGTVSRMDAGTGRTLSEFSIVGVPIALAPAGNVMWIAVGDRVWRMTRFEGVPSRDVRVPAGPVALAADESGAWVATRDRHVLHIDPAGDGVKQRFRLDALPSALGVGYGRVWLGAGGR